jgi:aryl-alcohol dehydrogenase-like predicted oxidoreductase
MKYNQLGRTGLYVSEICLGAMTFGGNEDAGIWRAIGSLDQGAVDDIVGRALAAGVNFFDTADVYSFGESERRLGQAFKTLASSDRTWSSPARSSGAWARDPTTPAPRAATSWTA